MENSSTALLSVVALVVLAACGGGGGAPAEAPSSPGAPAAPAAQAAAGPGAAPALHMATANVLGPQGTLQKPSVAAPLLDPSLVFRVRAELDHIEQVLRRGDDGQAETQEALDVINDARAELKKDRPNKLRLRSFLAGLARDVRVVDGTASPSESLGRLAPLI